VESGLIGCKEWDGKAAEVVNVRQTFACGIAHGLECCPHCRRTSHVAKTDEEQLLVFEALQRVILDGARAITPDVGAQQWRQVE